MTKSQARNRRHRRLRQVVEGTAARPRLAVFRSNKNISVQLIDDINATTIVATSSQALKVNGGNIEGAKAVGADIAAKAAAANITEVVFDRGGNQYHGRVEALATAAREAGLKF